MPKTQAALAFAAALTILGACGSNDTAQEPESGAAPTASSTTLDSTSTESNGRYVITNVRVKRDSPVNGDQPTFKVLFDARWQGDGSPPLTTCQYTLFADEEVRVASGVIRLQVGEGKGLGPTVQRALEAKPQSATVECKN